MSEQPRRIADLALYAAVGLVSAGAGGLVDDVIHPRAFVLALMKAPEVNDWSLAFHYADKIAVAFVANVALVVTGLLVLLIRSTPRQRGRAGKPWLPKALTLPTVVVLGLSAGFHGNHWLVARYFERSHLRLRLSTSTLVNPWDAMASLHPPLLIATLIAVVAAWLIWFVVGRDRRARERSIPA